MSYRVPLDPAVLRQVWKPLQRRCHLGKPHGCCSRYSCAPWPGQSCEEHGQHQSHLCWTKCAALWEAPRRSWQLQGTLTLRPQITFIIKSCSDFNVHASRLCIYHCSCVPPQLLADCLTVVVAGQLGASFTPEVQAAFQKFIAVVISALGRQYH